MDTQPEPFDDTLIWIFLDLNDEALKYGYGFELPRLPDGQIDYQYIWGLPPSILKRLIAWIRRDLDGVLQES